MLQQHYTTAIIVVGGLHNLFYNQTRKALLYCKHSIFTRYSCQSLKSCVWYQSRNIMGKFNTKFNSPDNAIMSSRYKWMKEKMKWLASVVAKAWRKCTWCLLGKCSYIYEWKYVPQQTLRGTAAAAGGCVPRVQIIVNYWWRIQGFCVDMRF